MKRTFSLSLVILLNLVFGVIAAYSQTVEITVEDLKKFRTAVVERDLFKKELEETRAQKNNWEISSSNWRNLYNAEKERADNIQGKIIKECDESKNALGKANFELHSQAKEDARKLEELEFDVRKLKSARKWYFAAGLATGAATGGYVGYKAGKRFTF